MPNPPHIAALIVSAGRGHRFGGGTPKQFLPLGPKSVLARSIEAFLGHPSVTRVRAVIHPDDVELYEAALNRTDVPPPIFGGPERQDSVRLGLQGLVEARPDVVLIHDAVRPLVSAGLIDRVVAAVGPGVAALPALPVTDTLKRAVDGTVAETVDRSALWRAQTPQGFVFREILSAHEAAAGNALTDDAAVAEAAGLRVEMVEGAEENLKITTQEDLERVRNMIGAAPATRVGTGYDVHRFTHGDRVILCGVEIPHSAALEGHSDADAGLHALTDALLGAAGLGDIGTFFPPSDERWRDAPSHIFLSHAAEMIAERGGSVVNADITIICENPKIGPYREQMRARVAEILNVDESAVNIKGTTTERLGFTGREEGIAAQAVATIKM